MINSSHEMTILEAIGPVDCEMHFNSLHRKTLIPRHELLKCLENLVVLELVYCYYSYDQLHIKRLKQENLLKF